MIEVYSKALNKTLSIDRVIGHIEGKNPGPTVIFIGGIHGNEPSGVFALHHVVDRLQSKKNIFNGNLYAIAGNLKALKAGMRYQNKDLNRLWKEEINGPNASSTTAKNADYTERSEFLSAVSAILSKNTGPFYFIDLHTTSSATTPFITINDNMLNRKFTRQYPVPLLLGIEEYLVGTFLNYINAQGYVAFGFESGQHDALSSIEKHEAFVYLTLVFARSLMEAEFDYHPYYQLLAPSNQKGANFFEIIHHYKIKRDERFSMLPGLQNFQPVKQGDKIATSNGESIKVPKSGLIFMPLYQKQGEDGFFIIRPIPTVFLKLSAMLRQIHFDYVLPLFPGISWSSEKRDALRVNLKVARFLAKQFFHLLGYRSRQTDITHMIIRNREATSRKIDYKKELWYRK
jgi:hypothetical protein